MKLKTSTSKFQLPKGSRGVTAIGISYDGKYVSIADNSNDHYVYVFELNSGK